MRERGGSRNQFSAVGRRKTSIARVLLQPGAGNVIVDGKSLEERFPRPAHQLAITLPLRLTNMIGTYNVLAHVQGGGDTGQAGAIVHATARALVKADEALKPVLRAAGLMTRDPRMKERKTPGFRRARKKKQFTKR